MIVEKPTESRAATDRTDIVSPCVFSVVDRLPSTDYGPERDGSR
jgi:hypothetical protein